MRTSFRERGYDINDPDTVRHHYLHGWFAIDLVSVLPFPLDAASEALGRTPPPAAAARRRPPPPAAARVSHGARC